MRLSEDIVSQSNPVKIGHVLQRVQRFFPSPNHPPNIGQ